MHFYAYYLNNIYIVVSLFVYYFVYFILVYLGPARVCSPVTSSQYCVMVLVSHDVLCRPGFHSNTICQRIKAEVNDGIAFYSQATLGPTSDKLPFELDYSLERFRPEAV